METSFLFSSLGTALFVLVLTVYELLEQISEVLQLGLKVTDFFFVIVWLSVQTSFLLNGLLDLAVLLRQSLLLVVDLPLHFFGRNDLHIVLVLICFR